VVFLDPRPPEAIAASTGLIRGAKNVPLSDIVQGKLPPELRDNWTRVITACQAGPMGAIAAHELSKLGFSRVNYMQGGTQGWLDAGLPTDR
jgi:rhodanese-related sulfurtransferase